MVIADVEILGYTEEKWEVSTMDDKLIIFLTGAYFGIDLKQDKDEIIVKKCIKKAYGDLQRNIPYKFSISKLEEMEKANQKEAAEEFEKEKGIFYQTIENIMFSFISEKKIADFKPVSLINEIYNIANAEENKIFKVREKFTYGLAQKWVNMTLKYLWLLDRCPINEESLDIPIDSYIISVACSEAGKNPYCLGLEPLGQKWSKWDESNWGEHEDQENNGYVKFQNEIKEAIKKKKREKNSSFEKISTNLEWENLAWLVQSKIEEAKSNGK